jgi:hypothetical protein
MRRVGRVFEAHAARHERVGLEDSAHPTRLTYGDTHHG